MMQKTHRTSKRGWTQGLFVACLLLVAMPVQAADIEQVIELEPGWNSIFIRLDPNDSDIASVFAGLPVRSVWRWIPDERGSEFVADPAEGLQTVDGWFGWFPEPRPEAFLSNLFTISPNTAYLVELEGTSNHQITIQGQPVFRAPAWQSDAFMLTGLPVSPDQPPTFAEFFESSGAHRGQPFYELQADGRWRLIDNPGATAIDADQAYWIFTQGNSDYQGKMHLVLDQGDSLDYQRVLDEIQFVIRNRSNLDGSFQIERIQGNTMPLRYRIEDPETGEVGWPAVQDVLVQPVEAGREVFMTLGIRRSEFTESSMSQVLSITDEHGGRILLHASGETLQPLVLPTRGTGPAASPGDFAGLWSGAIQIDAVSEAQQAGTEPTPTGNPFEQRVLIHVDSTGQARLLNDVILMWEEGTLAPSDVDPNFGEVDVPGRYVLITNKDLIPLYEGSVNRDGESVGQRFSTVAYDFGPNDEFLDMDGEFLLGSDLVTTLVIEPDLPTNPFRHKYHPDHDNLDAQFLNPREEAYQVVREMRFQFAVNDPLGADPPGWGSSIVGGTFQEALTGLHKNTIFVSGSFRLRRISTVPVLNQ